MKCKKNYLKLFSLIFIILFCYVFQTIVYSAFSSTMNINGSAHARIEADVRITDFRLASTNNATSLYEEFGKNHIITDVNLNNSSSSITYYLEITNYGSVDVGIFDITVLPNEVNYSIKDYNLHDKICDDSGKCNNFAVKMYEITLTSTSTYSGSIQLNFDFRTYHKVTYTDIENNGYPTEVIDGGNLSITFTEKLKKVSILSNAVEIKYYDQISSGQTIIIESVSNNIEIKVSNSLVEIISGDLQTIGSEIAIGDEHFYVISSDEDSVTMLAKYNLAVGNICTSSSSCTPIENSSGNQEPEMIGYPTGGSYPRYGTTVFSSTNYWGSVSNGTYVYDSNSTLYNYVESYKTYLESQGAEIEEAHLIKKEELETLGCSSSSYSCSSAPSWVYATSYWSGSASASNYVWYVSSYGDFYDSYYSSSNFFGCRPVITLTLTTLEI